MIAPYRLGHFALGGNLRFAAEARSIMMRALRRLRGEDGQDVAEYAIMLAVILAVVVGTIRLIGSNANNVFSAVGSSIQ
jgi:Flp pilus assembly pilin Flp